MAFHMKEFTAPSVKPELGGALNVAVTLREYGLGDVALLPEEKRRAIVDGVVESMRALSKCYQRKMTRLNITITLGKISKYPGIFKPPFLIKETYA